MLSTPSTDAVPVEQSEPISQTFYDQQYIIHHLQEAARNFGGLSKLEIDQSTIAAGIDSISVQEFSKLIETSLGIELPVPAILDYPTIETLSSYIAGACKLLYMLFSATYSKKRYDQSEVYQTLLWQGKYAHRSLPVLMPHGSYMRMSHSDDSNSQEIEILTSVSRLPFKGDVSECPQVIPFWRWDVENSTSMHSKGIRFGAIVSDVDLFDATVFGIGR
jgi:acyl carrier protein